MNSSSCQKRPDLWQTLFFLILVILSHSAFADDENSPFSNTYKLSGFGTLAATSAGSDELGYYRDYSHQPQTKDWSFKTDSMLGAQIDWYITPDFSANLQIVAKDRANNGLEESIEWANLKYNINSDWIVRAGRMGVDIYMLSEYRNVAYAYLWARPIVEYYQPVVFNHFDGVDISYTRPVNQGSLEFKLFAGETSVDLSNGESYTDLDFSEFAGFNLLYSTQDWKLRFGIVTAKITDLDDPLASLRPALSSIPTVLWSDIDTINKKLEYKDKRFMYYSAGFAYESDWQIQSEIAYMDSDWEYFPSSYSGYISAGKQIGEFTPYLILSTIKMKEDVYQVGTPSSGYGLEALQRVLSPPRPGPRTGRCR